MNSVVFGQYYQANSWVHRLDPRCKLISMFILMIGVFFVRNLYALAICLALAIILVFSTKVPIGKYLNSIKMIGGLLIFTFAFQIIFNHQGNALKTFDFTLTYINVSVGVILLILFFASKRLMPKHRLLQFLIVLAGIIAMFLYWGYGDSFLNFSLTIYDGSLNSSAVVLLRVFVLVCLSSTLTLCTKPTDITLAIEKMLKPFKKIGIDGSTGAMLISIALRFIPTLIHEAYRILRAQASRGVDFNEGGLGKKIRQMVSLLVPMFVISYKKAMDLANAMEARCYIPGEARTNLYVLRYKASDYITFIMSLLLLGAMITVRVML